MLDELLLGLEVAYRKLLPKLWDTAGIVASEEYLEDRLEILTWILRSYCANLGEENCNVNNLFEMAITKGNTEMMAVMLGMGADVNHRNDAGNIPLIIALEEGGVDCTYVIKMLLENGVDVNQQNAVGDTALIIAANSYSWFDVNIVKLLLNQGATFHHKNHSGDSALDIAVRIRNRGAVEFIIEHILRTNPETDLQKLLNSSQSVDSVQDYEKIITELIQHGEGYRKALNDITNKEDVSGSNGGRLPNDLAAFTDDEGRKIYTVPALIEPLPPRLVNVPLYTLYEKKSA